MRGFHLNCPCCGTGINIEVRQDYAYFEFSGGIKLEEKGATGNVRPDGLPKGVDAKKAGGPESGEDQPI